MANLVIDIGNTLTKIAVFKDRQIIYEDTRDRFGKGEIRELTKKYDITRSVVSSVSKKQDNYGDVFGDIDNIEFSGTTRTGINNKYKTPETLGADRLAAIVGANALFPGKNILVIDAGTCITFDAVDMAANYFGGSISPGITMRLKAMHTFTGKLPLLQADKGFTGLVGDDTKTCLMAGAVSGAYLELIGFIEEYKRKYTELQVLLCGGDAPFFDTRLKNSIFAPIVKFEPRLVLIGLNEVIHHHND